MAVKISLLFIFSILGISISCSSHVDIAVCPGARKSIMTTDRFIVPEPLISTVSGDVGDRKSLEFVLNSNYSFACGNLSVLKTMELDLNKVVFTQFGHLGRFNVIHGSKVIDWLNPDKFCGYWNSTKKESGDFKIGICQSPHQKHITVFKCCMPGYIMDLRTHDKLTCVPIGNRKWKLTWYDPESFQHGICAEKSKGPGDYHFVTELEDVQWPKIWLFTHPYSFFALNRTEKGTWWYLLKDGRLRSRVLRTGGTSGSKAYDEWENSYFGGPEFCVDGLVNSNHILELRHKISEVARIKIKSNATYSELPVYTTTDQLEKNIREKGNQKSHQIKTVSYVATFYITSILLVGVLFKSIFMLKRQHVRGYTLITYAASLIIANIFYGLSYSMSFIVHLHRRRGFWCTGFAMLAHFFILGSACWLVLVGWELRRSLRYVNPRIHRPDSLWRYVCYFFGVFGTLLLLFGWLLYRDINFGAFAWYFSSCPVLVPGYGVDYCFLSMESQDKLLYTPIVILNAIGLFLYILTIWHLYQADSPHFWIVEYIVNRGRTDPWLALVLKQIMVEFLSYTIDVLSLYWKPNTYTPEDASYPWIALSIAVTTGRAIVLCWVMNTKDPETRNQASHGVDSSDNAASKPISDSYDTSCRSNAAQEIEMVEIKASDSGSDFSESVTGYLETAF